MEVSDHKFVISNSDIPRVKTIYVTGVCFFIIDKMTCGMPIVPWSDIGLVSHVSTEGKTGNQMTLYLGSWNSYLISF